MRKPSDPMEILWAPWRIDYIRSEKEPGCIFCSKPAEDSDRQNLIVHRGREIFVIMNRFPYNNGHLLIVPYRHEADMNALSREENAEMMELLQRSARALKLVVRPQGFNIGMNVGTAAGAGIEDHLHFHIVPRWHADSNFMPVLGHTKIISEALEETWKQLFQAFQEV